MPGRTPRRWLRTWIWAALITVILTVATGRLSMGWRPVDGCRVSAEQGELCIFVWDATFWRINYPPGFVVEPWPWKVEFLPEWHNHSAESGTWHRQLGLRLPWWLAVGAALATAHGVSGLRSIARRRKGLCPWCAYPLPETGATCPECGPMLARDG